MSINLAVKTIMVFDLIAQKDVANIKLHSVSSELNKFVVASVWKNKDYNHEPFRMEDEGFTLLNFQEGQEVLISDITSQEDFWNTKVGFNQLEFLVV